MTRDQAVERARELVAAKAPFVMATVDEAGKPCMRWMGALAPDADCETVYYLVSAVRARKTAHIAANPAVELLFSSPDFGCVVNVSGVCELVDSASVRQRVWDENPVLANYFAGVDDPNFGTIKFTAQCLEVLCMGENHEPVRVSLCE